MTPFQVQLLLEEAPYAHPTYRLLDFLHAVHTDKHQPLFPARTRAADAEPHVIPELEEQLIAMGYTPPPK